ncbi:STN domain-containing protein [bacterium]|nr:STN domain-containing protein [bacterium]
MRAIPAILAILSLVLCLGHGRAQANTLTPDGGLFPKRDSLFIQATDLPLREALMLICDKGGYNVALASDVGRTKVDLNLRGVTLDEAFTSLLLANGLSYKKTGKTLIIRPDQE